MMSGPGTPAVTWPWGWPWPRHGSACGGYTALHLDSQSHPLHLAVRPFYVPAAGAISLLGSWLVTRLPRRPSLAAVTSAAAVMMSGLGAWSFTVIREFWLFPGRDVLCPVRRAG
jgi:hypothetical protein